GLASDGLHTNGFSLARKVAFDVAGLKVGDRVSELGMSIDEALMKVHRCYSGPILELLAEHEVHGMAHVTGGGLPGNLKRILPDQFDAEIRKSSWEVPSLFKWLEETGNVDSYDMYRAFNMGIGYVLVVPEGSADDISSFLTKKGETVVQIGKIIPGKKTVQLV
ncbi:MAG: AIR synthase-related protein, partial [candidate division Zixibacteria bacterium]